MKPKSLGDTEIKVYHDEDTDKLDEYTVVLDNNYIFGMSKEPFHGHGVNQFTGQLKTGKFKHPSEFGKRVPWGDVPEGVKKAIKNRLPEKDKEKVEEVL